MSEKTSLPGKHEDLIMENVLLRAKIELLTGHGVDSIAQSPDMPPAIENLFLHHMLQFEEARKKAKEITVYEALNKPEFKKEPELSDSEIDSEIKRLEKLMLDRNISCHTINTVAPRNYYKFLTEELMKEEMHDINIPGMMCCFIYEEFHQEEQGR